MTLVITQASTTHIIMVGDSALTSAAGRGTKSYSTGCQKVQYASKARVGISMWGAAYISDGPGPSVRIDRWVSNFIAQNDMERFEATEDKEARATSHRNLFPVDYIARRLASRLNCIDRCGFPSSRKRGFHVAGYIQDANGEAVPHVYHVRPDEGDDYYECNAYLDYPDGVADAEYVKLRNGNKFTLRNGYYPLYNPIMNFMDDLAKNWRSLEGFSWPQQTTEDQLSFLSLQVMFIAQALIVAKNGGEVDSRISTLAILPDGRAMFSPQPLEGEDFSEISSASDWVL